MERHECYMQDYNYATILYSQSPNTIGSYPKAAICDAHLPPSLATFSLMIFVESLLISSDIWLRA
jgi:hypothetical protein